MRAGRRMSPRLVTSVDLPVTVTDAFAWHERPGAFQRLTPPWERVTVEEAPASLEVGATAVLRTSLGPVTLRWVAEHVTYDPPHQFVDVQRRGPFAEWVHRHRFEERPGGSRLTDDVTYRLPGGVVGEMLAGPVVRRRLERMFAYRHRQLAADLARVADKERSHMKVAVTGSTGLIGEALVAALSTAGHEVVRMRRGPAGPGELTWTPGARLDPASLDGVHAVVHLAGAPIGAGRWTAARKRAIRDSRVEGTRTIAEAIARADDPPKVLVSGSAIDFYGDRGDEVLDESSSKGEGFLPDVVAAWEAAADPAREAGVRVVHPRTSIVLSPAGGALRRLLPLFKLGLGGRLGDGSQWWPWISIDDEVAALQHLLVADHLEGPVNLTAPSPATNAEFTGTLAQVLGRPALLPVPRFGPRLLLGEMADQLLFTSRRVRPAKLDGDAGFAFAHPDLEGALRHLLGRPA